MPGGGVILDIWEGCALVTAGEGWVACKLCVEGRLLSLSVAVGESCDSCEIVSGFWAKLILVFKWPPKPWLSPA